MSKVRVHVRSLYDHYDADDYGFACEGPSLTVQSEAASCDINNIMKRYEASGLVDHVNRFQGDYADVTPFPDFHTAQNMVVKAQEAFMSIPAAIRNRFGNSPHAFLEFVNNPANLPELVKLGLAVERVPSPSPSQGRQAAQEPGEGDERPAKPAKGSGGREPPAAA